MELNGKSILLDARKIEDGGIGVYTQNLIADLTQRKIPLTLLGCRETLSRFPWIASTEVVEDSAQPYSRDELFSLARRIDFSKYALFHTPHYMLPFGIPIPTVVTIHDLIHLTHPQKLFYPLAAWPLVASALMRATSVVTVSRAAQRDIQRLFPFMAREKVRVVPNRLPDEFLKEPLEEITISDDYAFVSVSQSKPHKGVLDLLHAWIEAQPNLKLVIGGYGAEKLSTFKEYRRILQERSDIKIVGALDSAGLRRYYAGARAVIVPSRAEGFGLPVIEAHALGARVVMRPVPALLELRVVGDIVAKDFSIEALAQSLREMTPLTQAQRNVLKESTTPFSGESMIAPMLEVYSRTLQLV